MESRREKASRRWITEKTKKKSSNDDAKDIIKGAVGSALGAGLYKAVEYILHMLLK